MSILQPALVACVLCLCSASCQRAPLPTPNGVAGTSATMRDEPARATSGGNRASYLCADGSSLDVVYAGGNAELRWPGGRRLVLPRAESASKGDGDVYVDDTVSFLRDGRTLQLHDGASTLACEEADMP